MIIARVVALGVLASLVGYSWPAKAEITVLRCVGGPPLMAAIDLEMGIFYLRHPFVKSWYVRHTGRFVYIPGMGQLSLADGILKWGGYTYRCEMSSS
jgi:hypothetical protein